LKPRGRIRIAVPDKNRKDKKYSEAVRPPIDGHKSYFNYLELSEILTKVGFEVELLEYHDKDGEFIANKWDVKFGKIKRSVRYDKQIEFKKGKLYYTSLIVDGIK
jgi:predicted SAM-dependent methyltransferase